MGHRYVDFHCHLDLYPDFAAAVADAEAEGVYTLTVTTTPQAWPRNYEQTRNTRFVRAALGLHPQLVHERASELSLWEQYLPQTRYVGEVGIDAGPKFYRSLEAQKEIFEYVLKCCARAGGKILTVHSVRSAKLVLDLIEENFRHGRGQVVLHWFTGSISEALRAVELGCYFSVNPQMLQGERGRALVSTLPRHRLLTETDGPFTEISGRPSTAKDVVVALDGIAALQQWDSQECASQITANLKQLLEFNCSIESQMKYASTSFAVMAFGTQAVRSGNDSTFAPR